MKTMEKARVLSRPDPLRVLFVALVAGTLLLAGRLPAQHGGPSVQLPEQDLAAFAELEVWLLDSQTRTMQPLAITATEEPGRAPGAPGSVTMTACRLALVDGHIEIVMAADLAGQPAFVRATLPLDIAVEEGPFSWKALVKIVKQAVKKVIKVLEKVVELLDVLDETALGTDATPRPATAAGPPIDLKGAAA